MKIITYLLFAILLFSCSSNQQGKKEEPIKKTESVKVVKEVKKEPPKTEEQQILEDWEEFKKAFQNYDYFEDRDERLANTPATLKDAMKELEKNSHPKDLEMLRNLENDSGAGFHFGFGMGLRNSWGLWDSSKISRHLYSRGIEVGDHMSGVIIGSFIKYVQGKKWQLDIEDKFPEHFKIVDAVLSYDHELLKKLTEDLEKLPERGKLPSPIDVALFSCNASAFTILNRFEKRTKLNRETFWYCQRHPEFFADFVNQNPDSLKDDHFALVVLSKPGVLSKSCDKIKGIDPEMEKEIFSDILYFGTEEDFKCANRIFKNKPEVRIRDFASKYFSGEKKKYILENHKPEIFKNTSTKIIEEIAGISYKRIKEFTEISGVAPIYVTKLELFKNKDSRIINLFLDAENIKPGERKLRDQSYFEYSIENCNPIAIEYLIKNGFNPNYIKLESLGYYSNEISNLYSGCYFNKKGFSETMFKYLIMKGLDIKNSESKPFRPIDIVSKSSLNMLKFLNKHGYNFKYNIKTRSPLAFIKGAISNKNPEVLEWLIKDHGLNINELDSKGNTLLHLSVQHSEIKRVKFLLSKNADITIKNNNKESPLDVAIRVLEIEQIKMIAEIERLDNNGGDTTSSYISRNVNTAKEILKLLKDYKKKTNQ